jgi:hypothetical protein
VSATDEAEDRGQVYHVWIESVYYTAHFVPMDGHRHLHLSVPIGWKMESDKHHGVVIRHTYGHTLTATKAYRKARDQEDGFKLRT